MARRSGNLAALVRALEQIGGTSPKVIVIAILFVLLLQLFTDGVERLLTFAFGEWAVYVPAVIVVPLLLLGGAWWVRRRYRPRPLTRERTGPFAETLVLFLSPPGQTKDRKRPEALVEEARERARRAADDPTCLQDMDSPWRMPLEAVRFHREHLKRVVVITSPQTSGWMNALREVLQAHCGTGVEIVEAAAFTGRSAQPDFGSDIEGLLDVVDAVYGKIEQEGENPERTVVDVTGGTKLCSLAGLAAVQPFPGRCFQYVFAQRGGPAQVRIWDATFEMEQRSG